MSVLLRHSDNVLRLQSFSHQRKFKKSSTDSRHDWSQLRMSIYFVTQQQERNKFFCYSRFGSAVQILKTPT